MRSRYSAYTIQNSQYIYQTYSKEEQAKNSVADIDQWAKSCKWIKLEITQSHEEKLDQPNTVEFMAYYLHNHKLFILHENSMFIKEDKLWRYSTGEIIAHKEVKALKRNDRCPCDSGKKYKQCCLN